MFRAIILSVLLTLGVGQNTPLICGVWCQAGDAGMMGLCEHHESALSPTISGREDCSIARGVSAFLVEDARRDVTVTCSHADLGLDQGHDDNVMAACTREHAYAFPALLHPPDLPVLFSDLRL
jgi:hypothetical protein